MTGPWHTLYSAVPEFLQYDNKTHLIFAGTTKGFALNERPTEDIVKEIREAKARGKNKFVFAGSAETIIIPVTKKAQTVINLLPEIPEKDFFFHVAGIEAQKDYDDFVKKHNYTKKFSIIATHQFEYFTNCNMHQYFLHIANPQYKIENREKLFVCFNKIDRNHRTRLITKMINSGLIEKGFYSFEGSPNPAWIDQIITEPRWDDEVKRTFTENRSKFPMRLNITPERSNPVDLQPDDLPYHEKSYFSIVTETMFYNTAEEVGRPGIYMMGTDGVFISEKTYKTMAFKHPFIIVGQAGILKALKKYGYKTFHPFIDESYDDVTDSDKRFEMLWAEIQRLCSFTAEQWLEWQRQVLPIIEHNFQVLRDKKSFLINDNINELHQLFSK